MVAKDSNEPTLGDVVLSISGIKTQIDGLQSQMDGVKSEIGSVKSEMGGMRSEISKINDRMVTKSEFSTAINRLDSSIKREAGDLDESIASLSSMVADKLGSGPAWRKYKLR